MKVQFVLLGFSKKPIGGYKVVYEYSNYLIKKGYDVTIYFDCSERLKERIPIEIVRKKICMLCVQIFPRWYKLSKSIKKKAIFSIDNTTIKDGEYVVATAIETAYKVAGLSGNKGKKIYLIQDYENWRFEDKWVDDSYRLGMNNVVISKWLQKKVKDKSGKEPLLIPNSIETNIFRVKTPIELRDGYEISFLYHEGKHKGIQYLIEALKKVREEIPEIKVKSFGVYKTPKIPEWIEYRYNASIDELVELYNSTSIFVCATIEEGFGLTGLESMACGCALVSTRYTGVLEYAENGYNALLSDVKDVTALVENICYLIKNPKKRIELAHNASISAGERNWDTSIQLFIDNVLK